MKTGFIADECYPYASMWLDLAQKTARKAMREPIPEFSVPKWRGAAKGFKDAMAESPKESQVHQQALRDYNECLKRLKELGYDL